MGDRELGNGVRDFDRDGNTCRGIGVEGVRFLVGGEKGGGGD